MERVDRFFLEPRQSFFLFGPRGTGKSTWLRRRFPDAIWVDLLEPGLQRSLAARLERSQELIDGEPSRKTDFVVYGRDVFWAVEVKSSPDVRPADLRGLRALVPGKVPEVFK